MEIGRIKYLREQLKDESIDLVELSEIDEAYHQWANNSTTLSEDPDNATASDKLDELESNVSDLEWIIYEHIAENYDDADDPCYAIGPLAAHIEQKLNAKEKK